MASRWLTRFCAGLARAIQALTIAILAAILLANALEIVSRTFFDRAHQWIYETNLLLASWLYFLGIVLVYRAGGDITMVGLKTLLPAGLHRGFDRVVALVSAAVFLVLGWYAWSLVELQWPFRTPGVGFPRAAFTMPLLIGAVAVALQLLADALAPADDRGPGHAAR